MFKRRDQKTFVQRLSNFFWPQMGWSRTKIYWKYRICRMPGSVYAISCGFACGAAISFTPFVGFHFILGGIFAWLFRGSIIASAIGTAIGNPWTFPFIWIWIYNCGLWMGFSLNDTSATSLDFVALFREVGEAFFEFNFNYLLHSAGPVLWIMLLGSIPTVIFVWLFFYFFIGNIINTYRESRLSKINSRHKK